METIQRLLAPLAAYPRWFVITCLVVAALAVGWLLAKVLKWTLYVVIFFVLLGAAVLALTWLLG